MACLVVKADLIFNMYGVCYCKHTTLMVVWLLSHTLLAQDLHGGWDPITNHAAPLYGTTPGVTGPEYSVDNAVQTLIKGGCQPSKLNMGVPLYGQVFKGVGKGLNHSKVGSGGVTCHAAGLKN